MYTVKDRVELESLLPNPSQQIRKYLPSYGLEHVKYLIGLLEKLRDKVNSRWETTCADVSIRVSLGLCGWLC